MNPPEEIWHDVLAELTLQLPQATFANWLQDSQVVSADDESWEISVSSPQAQAWLERRLATTVQQTLDRTLAAVGQPPARLRFVVDQPDSERRPPHPGAQVLYQFVEFDLFERGWLKVPHYYELFWQPLLGYPAYAFWRYQQLVNWSTRGDYTRQRVIDLSRAAAHLGIDRKVLKGAQGGQIGGALAQLQDQGVGQFQVHGRGRHTSYSGRLLRALPLLSPAQAAQLPPTLREEHDRWLLDAGFDLDGWYDLAPAPLAGADRPEAAPFARPDWEALEPLGYLITPAYYDLFWQPLLGPEGYAAWRLLKCRYYAPNQRYTRERHISVDAIAQQVGCHRQAITGCLRRRGGRRIWQPGAFDRLQAERVAAVRSEGDGRQRTYRIRALNAPPLLTPAQVARLPALLRNAHDEWLERARLDLEAWQQLDLPFLTECEPDDVPGATEDMPLATDDMR